MIKKLFILPLLIILFSVTAKFSPVFAEEFGGIPVGPKIVCTAPNPGSASPISQVANNWSGECTPTEVIVTTLTLSNDLDVFRGMLQEMIDNGLRPVIRIAGSEQYGDEWQLPGGGPTEMYDAGVNLANIINEFSSEFCAAPIVIPFNEPNLPDEMGGLSGEEAQKAFAQLVKSLINGINDGGGKQGWLLYFPPLALNPDAADQSAAIQWLEDISKLLDLSQFDGAGFTLYGADENQLADLYKVMAQWFLSNGYNFDFLITEIGGWENGSPIVSKEKFTEIIEAFLQGLENGTLGLIVPPVGILMSFFIDRDGNGKADLTCFVYLSPDNLIQICCYDGTDPTALDDPSQLSCIDCYVPNHNHYKSDDDDCPANEWVRIGDCSDPLEFTNVGFPSIPSAVVYADGELPRPECEALLNCETGLPAISPNKFACESAYIGHIFPDGKPFEDRIQAEIANDYELGPRFREAFVTGIKASGVEFLDIISNSVGPLAKMTLPFTDPLEKNMYARFFETPSQTDKRSLVRYFIRPSGEAIDPIPGFAAGAVLMSDLHDTSKITEIWCRTSHLIYSSITRSPGVLDIVPFDCEVGRPTPKKSGSNVPHKKPVTGSSTDNGEKSTIEKIISFVKDPFSHTIKLLAPALAQQVNSEICGVTVSNIGTTLNPDGSLTITFEVTAKDGFTENGGQGYLYGTHIYGGLYTLGGEKITDNYICQWFGGSCKASFTTTEVKKGDEILIKAIIFDADTEICPNRETEMVYVVGSSEGKPGGGSSSTGSYQTSPWFEKDYCVKESGTKNDFPLCISSMHARVPLNKVTRRVKIKWPSPIAGTPDCIIEAKEMIAFEAEEWTQYPMVYSITAAWMFPSSGIGGAFFSEDSPAIKVEEGGSNIRETNWIQYLAARTAGINPDKLFFTEIPIRKYTQRQLWKPFDGYPAETITQTKQDYYATYGIYTSERGFGDGVTNACSGTFCPVTPEGKPIENEGEKADIPIGVIPRMLEMLSVPNVETL